MHKNLKTNLFVDIKDKKRRSPIRRNHRSRSPTSRRKSPTHSKNPVMTRQRSRSHTDERSRSRSQSPYYNRNKYSSHR